jgi:hypothetical protein
MIDRVKVPISILVLLEGRRVFVRVTTTIQTLPEFLEAVNEVFSGILDLQAHAGGVHDLAVYRERHEPHRPRLREFAERLGKMCNVPAAELNAAVRAALAPAWDLRHAATNQLARGL